VFLRRKRKAAGREVVSMGTTRSSPTTWSLGHGKYKQLVARQLRVGVRVRV